MRPAQILDKFQFDTLPRDGAVFWAHGGQIIDSDERRILSINEEVKNAFLQVENHKHGITELPLALKIRGGDTDIPQEASVDLSLALGYDRDSTVFFRSREVSFWEEQHFWRDVSKRFSARASGIITVAVAGAQANTNFRVFEYPAIMGNREITGVSRLESEILPSFMEKMFLDVPTGRMHIVTYGDDEGEFEKMYDDPDKRWIHASVMYRRDQTPLSKQDWSIEQKQQWFNNASDNLLMHLEGRTSVEIPGSHGSRAHYGPSDINFTEARARFLCEIYFCLREASVLTKKAGLGDGGAQNEMDQEYERLAVCLDLLQQYPELVDYDTQPSERYVRPGTNEVKYGREWLTQELGRMLLRLDNGLTVEDKNNMWGRYHDYRMIGAPPEFMGKPDVVENYVRQSLSVLPSQISAALKKMEALMPLGPQGRHRDHRPLNGVAL